MFGIDLYLQPFSDMKRTAEGKMKQQ